MTEFLKGVPVVLVISAASLLCWAIVIAAFILFLWILGGF